MPGTRRTRIAAAMQGRGPGSTVFTALIRTAVYHARAAAGKRSRGRRQEIRWKRTGRPSRGFEIGACCTGIW